jgi:fimbrial chaperone protein
MSVQKIPLLQTCVILISVGLLSVIQAGYSLNPLITILEVSKKQMSAEVVVKFEGDVKAPIALELKVKGREVSLDGKTVLYHDDKSEDNFVIYPAQIVLMPGEMQRVQVKWVGDSIPSKEIVYGLIAEEAPIKVGDEDKVRTKAEARLIIRARYEGAIVIRPAGIKPDVVVESTVSKTDSLGKPRLVITLHNKGTGLQNLAGIRIRVAPISKSGSSLSGKSVIFTPVLTKEQTNHSVFAGYYRTLNLPWPADVPVGPVNVAVEFPK